MGAAPMDEKSKTFPTRAKGELHAVHLRLITDSYNADRAGVCSYQ
jgi:hypothetical protein